MARPRTISDDQILDAARTVFVDEGPSASMATIAARLGVTHAAIHQRFGSKKKLFLRAMCPAGPPGQVMAALHRGPQPGGTAQAQLLPLLESLLAFLRQTLPQLIALRTAGADLVPSADESMPALLRSALATWLTAARSAGLTAVVDPEATAEGLLGALEARALNEHLGAATPGAPFLAPLIGGLVPAASPSSTVESPDEPSEA